MCWIRTHKKVSECYEEKNMEDQSFNPFTEFK